MTTIKETARGSLKPMCQQCLRRVYGHAKDGGWWCSNCEAWIVKPKKSTKPRAPQPKTPRYYTRQDGAGNNDIFDRAGRKHLLATVWRTSPQVARVICRALNNLRPSGRK